MAVASNKTDCPSEELLAKLASDACEGADAERLRAHAKRCARCTRWLADAKDSEAILPDVREALIEEAKSRRPQKPSPPPPPDPFGRLPNIEGYELKEEIGRGGMGVVYLAYQKATKRDVALKVLLEGPFASATTKRRFEREVELAAQLQHQYIVTILESGISSGLYYFAMQYVEGRRLDDYIATSKPSIKQTLQLIGKVCEAVNYAQQHGVIHRDLKPSNIIVDDDGNPHVLDFGLAKLADASISEHGVPSLLSLDGQLMGTLAYMSPEQAAGSNQNIDIRTDVYSLGMLLYQSLTGRFPYEVVGIVTSVVDNIRNTEPGRPSKIRAEINDEIETIVLKALSKEPDRRYQTAGDLGQDITRHLTGDAIEAKRDSSLYMLKKALRRYWIPIAVTAGFVAVLAVSLAVTSSLFFQAKEDRDRAMVSEKEARWQAYVGIIAAAQSTLATNDIVGTQRFLDKAPRGFRQRWEWRYLRAACDESLTTLRGHTDDVTSVAIDPSGKFLASGSLDGTVRIWDRSSGLEVHCIKKHGGPVRAVAFRPDGEFLASASDDKTVRVWDTSTWQEAFALEGHEKEVLSVTFSPDGTRLASGSKDDTVRLWDSSTGEQLDEWPVKIPPHAWGDGNHVHCVAFSADGRQLAAATWHDESVHLWDLDSGRPQWTRQWKDAGGLSSVAFSPDGEYLATGSQNHDICIWTRRGEQWRFLRGHTGPVRSVAFDTTTDNLLLVSAANDATIRTWDASTSKQLRVMRGHASTVWSARFTGDGKQQVVSASADTTIRIWDTSASTEPTILGEHEDKVLALAFSKDGMRLASGASVNDRAIRIWDICTGEMEAILEREKRGNVYSVAFNSDGTPLAAEIHDKIVYVWNAQTAEKLLSLPRQPDSIDAVAFSPNGKYLALASDHSTVRLWEMSTGRESWNGDDHEEHVLAFAFSPSGTRLASASKDGTVRLWDVANGEILGVLDKHEDAVMAVAFSSDGTRLASGSCDSTVRIWDTITGKELRILRVESGAVTCVAFSPDGARLAAPVNAEAIALWDTLTGDEVIRFPSHGALCMAFSPDGTRLVSGASDWTLRHWDSVPYGIRYQEREAALAAKRGDFQTAEAVFRKAWDGIREVLGEAHQGTLPPLKGLIESLIAQGEFAKAQPPAVKHYERNELAYGQTHPLTVNAARLLVELYDAWARPDEAAEWRAKLSRAGSAADVEQMWSSGSH